MPIINHFPTRLENLLANKKELLDRLIDVYQTDRQDSNLSKQQEAFLTDIINLLTFAKTFRERINKVKPELRKEEILVELKNYDWVKAQYRVEGNSKEKEIMHDAVKFCKSHLFNVIEKEKVAKRSTIIKERKEQSKPLIYLSLGHNISDPKKLKGGSFGDVEVYAVPYKYRKKYETLHLMRHTKHKKESLLEREARKIVVKTIRKPIQPAEHASMLDLLRAQQSLEHYQQAKDNLPNEIAINEEIRQQEIKLKKPSHCCISTGARLGKLDVIVSCYERNGDLLSYLGKLRENAGEKDLTLAQNCGEMALTYFERLTDAMHFLHDIGVLHNDIALRNVMVNEGQAELSDFGLAVKYDPKHPDQPVTINSTLLPIKWQSVSIAEGQKSQATDAFALKITFLEIVAALSEIEPASILHLKNADNSLAYSNADFRRRHQALGDEGTLLQIRDNLLETIKRQYEMVYGRCEYAQNVYQQKLHHKPFDIHVAKENLDSHKANLYKMALIREQMEIILSNDKLFKHNGNSNRNHVADLLDAIADTKIALSALIADRAQREYKDWEDIIVAKYPMTTTDIYSTAFLEAPSQNNENAYLSTATALTQLTQTRHEHEKIEVEKNVSSNESLEETEPAPENKVSVKSRIESWEKISFTSQSLFSQKNSETKSDEEKEEDKSAKKTLT